MNLVLFDLDNTLLAGDSDFEWAQFLIAQGVLDQEVHAARNAEFYDQYRAGTLDIHEFLDFQLKPLSRHPRRELEAWRAEFMREHILPIITKQARQIVRDHLNNGALVAIVTATNSFVTAPIANEFGVAHLVATEPEEINGEFTGAVRGLPCFREGKIARVDAWLAQLGHAWDDFEETTFYSDSLNDFPLLKRVRHPIAVDPDRVLEEYAREHGWPVLSLRS